MARKRRPSWAERHLQMPILQRSRSVDDLDRRGVEHRTRIAQPERPHRVEALHQSGVIAFRLSGASMRSRGEAGRARARRRPSVDATAELADPAPPPSSGRRPDCGRRTGRRGRRTARAPPACRSPECCGTIHARRRRRPIGRWPACEGVHQLRRGDADDAAVPAFAADDEHVVRADRRVGLDRLRLGDEVGFFGCRRRFSSLSWSASPRASSPIASSVASSSRVAMSGVLIRPAAFTRGRG